MRFKPVPDSVQCATIDAKHITVVKDKKGTWRVFVTDSDYVQSRIVEPSIEELEAHIFYNQDMQKM